jgi:Recombinase
LRSGQLLPWSVPPYGYVMDPEHPRDPRRLRLDPVKAAVITQIFAWYTDPQTPATLYGIAEHLAEGHIPTLCGGRRWNVASVRGILCSPVYTGTAYGELTRPGLPASVSPPCARWGRGVVIGRLYPKTGLLSLRRPSSARKPSRQLKPGWRAILKWPVGTTPPLSTCCAAWSVLASVNRRV